MNGTFAIVFLGCFLVDMLCELVLNPYIFHIIVLICVENIFFSLSFFNLARSLFCSEGILSD